MPVLCSHLCLRACGGVNSAGVSRALVDGFKLWKRSVSFGGVASSAELPFYFSHASVDADTRAQHSGVADEVTPGLVRLSVGIEHPQDLIDDLAQALAQATQGDMRADT